MRHVFIIIVAVYGLLRALDEGRTLASLFSTWPVSAAQGIREEVRVRRPDPRIRPPAVLRVWISATEVYLVLGATPGPVGWHDRIVDAQGFPHPQALRCHAQEHQNLKEFARTG